MRPATLIALGVLLALIMGAAALQFLLAANQG